MFSSLLITFCFAFLVVVASIVLLGIGWIVSGKPRLRPGACGRDPNKNREECDSTMNCHFCDKKGEDEGKK